MEFSTSLTREPGEFSGSTPTTQPPLPRTSWVTVHRWILYWPNTAGLQVLNGVSLQQASPLHQESPFTETRYLSRRTAMEKSAPTNLQAMARAPLIWKQSTQPPTRLWVLKSDPTTSSGTSMRDCIVSSDSILTSTRMGMVCMMRLTIAHPFPIQDNSIMIQTRMVIFVIWTMTMTQSPILRILASWVIWVGLRI